MPDMGYEEWYKLLLVYNYFNRKETSHMASIISPAESIEAMVEDPLRDIYFVPDFSEDIIEYVSHNSSIQNALQVLTEREREIILRRYGFNSLPDSSLDELAKVFGITRERVRQIELKARIKILVHLYKKHEISKEHYVAARDKLKRKKNRR